MLKNLRLERTIYSGFRRSFEEAERRGLVFVNPRRNFGKADTLEKALEEKQYRIKDLVRKIAFFFRVRHTADVDVERRQKRTAVRRLLPTSAAVSVRGVYMIFMFRYARTRWW